MRDKIYRCQKCESENLGNDWDRTTAEICKTNEVVPIGEGMEGVFFYCPTCKERNNYPDILHIKVVDCEYCEGDVDDRKALIWVEGHYKIHIDENNCIESGEYPSEEKKINYCPICGRKLGE